MCCCVAAAPVCCVVVWAAVLLVCCMSPVCFAGPAGRHLLAVGQDQGEHTDDIMNYFMRYGYLAQDDLSNQQKILDPAEVTKAIINFQKMANLTVTGKMDEATYQMTLVPRCGNTDLPSATDSQEADTTTADTSDLSDTDEAHVRQKRYLHHWSSWRQSTITYYIEEYTSDLSSSTVREVIDEAFQAWEYEIDLHFERVTSSSRADVLVKFASGYHGDNYPFDGLSGTLAHAFYPSSRSNDMHFDDAERWTTSSQNGRGVDLYQIAVHEIGHLIGLQHSTHPNAVMKPFYHYVYNFALHTDDIDGAVAKYGVNPDRENDTEESEEVSVEEEEYVFDDDTGDDGESEEEGQLPRFCRYPQVDTITYSQHHDITLGFKGSELYEINDSGGIRGDPRVIQDVFPDLPNDIDDAVYAPDRNTYFFKNEYVYILDGNELSGPHHRNDIFPALADLNYIDDNTRFDAVFVWSGRANSVYFFYGLRYFRYEFYSDLVLSRYPRPISAFAGLTQRVDTVYLHPHFRRTYFFKEDDYYRFNDYNYQWDAGYPKSVSEKWFRCQELSELRDVSSANETTAPADGLEADLAGIEPLIDRPADREDPGIDVQDVHVPVDERSYIPYSGGSAGGAAPSGVRSSCVAAVSVMLCSVVVALLKI